MNDTINDKINDLPYYVEGLEGSLREYQQEITKLNKKYNKLQSNWNSLREWVQSEYNRYLNDTENLIYSNVEVMDFSRMLNKMNELEGVENESNRYTKR